MVAESGPISFHARVDHILDSCTRCGKCVAACPMVEPAGIALDEDGADAPTISGILDLLSGGKGTPAAERWADQDARPVCRSSLQNLVLSGSTASQLQDRCWRPLRQSYSAIASAS